MTWKEIFLKEWQNLSKARWKRVILLSGAVAVPWTAFDFFTDNITFNIWHDLTCLVIGIVLERILPWDKQTPGAQV